MNNGIKKIKVVQNGVEKDADVIAAFKLEEYGKDYILYTFNERQNDNIKILASTYTKKEDGFIFENIKTDEEWTKIKGIIRDLAKGGENK